MESTAGHNSDIQGLPERGGRGWEKKRDGGRGGEIKRGGREETEREGGERESGETEGEGEKKEKE